MVAGRKPGQSDAIELPSFYVYAAHSLIKMRAAIRCSCVALIAAAPWERLRGRALRHPGGSRLVNTLTCCTEPTLTINSNGVSLLYSKAAGLARRVCGMMRRITRRRLSLPRLCQGQGSTHTASFTQGTLLINTNYTRTLVSGDLDRLERRHGEFHSPY